MNTESFRDWLGLQEQLSHGGHSFRSDDPADYEASMGVRDSDPKKGKPFYYSPFNRRDRREIRDPGYFSSVGKTLGRTPEGFDVGSEGGGYKWNIIFLELDPSESRFGKYEEAVEGYMREHGLSRDGHITFVKNRSSGDGVSKWILFHNVGHALFDKPSGTWEENAVHKDGIMRVLYDIFAAHKESHGEEPEGNRFHVMQVASRYFPHKSGESSHRWKVDGRDERSRMAISKRGISSLNEMVYELVSQYIMTGKVRLTNDARFAGEHLPGGRAMHQLGSYVAPELKPSRLSEDFLRGKSLLIQHEIAAALRNAVGKVIYHYRPLYGSTTPVPAHKVRAGSEKFHGIDARDMSEPYDTRYRIAPDHHAGKESRDDGVERVLSGLNSGGA